MALSQAIPLSHKVSVLIVENGAAQRDRMKLQTLLLGGLFLTSLVLLTFMCYQSSLYTNSMIADSTSSPDQMWNRESHTGRITQSDIRKDSRRPNPNDDVGTGRDYHFRDINQVHALDTSSKPNRSLATNYYGGPNNLHNDPVLQDVASCSHGESFLIKSTRSGSVTKERRLDDGKFIVVPGERYRFYMFSAFWDDRVQVESPVVRLIALLGSNSIVNVKEIQRDIFCQLFCLTNDAHVRIEISRPETVLYNNPEREKVMNEVVNSLVITCKPCACASNNMRVSLGNSPDKSEAENHWEAGMTSPVELVQKRNEPVVELGTCVPLVYGHLNPFFLVEWIELQKILGVGQMFVTSDGLDQETTKVIDHYVRQGFMKVQNSHFIHLKDNWYDVRVRSSMSVTHCMYRNMYNFNRIMILDADEIIVPRMHHTLPELIRDLEGDNARTPSSFKFLHSDYIMETQYGARPDPTYPEYSAYLRFRLRTEYFEGSYHVKSIVNPMLCATCRNHGCSNQLHGATATMTLVVNRTMAADCHFRSSMKKPQWLEGSQKLVPDDIMLPFADRLASRVRGELEALNLVNYSQSSEPAREMKRGWVI